MRQLVAEALASDLLVATADHIVYSTANPWEAAQLIRSWLAEHVRFTTDPMDELLRSPVSMLRDIEDAGQAEGDCDDVAMLGAALGKAEGFPAWFHLVGFTPSGPFSHVYTVLLTDQGPVDLDTTRPAQLPRGLRVWRTADREV